MCGRHKLHAIIFEQAEQASPFPRGETVHSAKILTQILGANVLSMIGTHFTAARLFYSPSLRYSKETFRETPSIVFVWSRFIRLLLDRLQESGTEIRYNTPITTPLIDDGRVVGVITGSGEKFYGKTILACDGAKSQLGQFYHVPYEKMNNLIIKRTVQNASLAYMGFQYIPIVPCQLSYAPRFPPAVVFIFPHGNGECELGFMTLTHEALKLSKYCDMPDETEMHRVWVELLRSHPILMKIMPNKRIQPTRFARC